MWSQSAICCLRIPPGPPALKRMEVKKSVDRCARSSNLLLDLYYNVKSEMLFLYRVCIFFIVINALLCKNVTPFTLYSIFFLSCSDYLRVFLHFSSDPVPNVINMM